jgi:hypothetical protein
VLTSILCSFADATDSTSIQTSSQALKQAKNILSTCATNRYLIATQPGVSAADLRGPAGCTMPNLCQAAEDSRVQGKLVISEVVGDISSSELTSYIESACAAKGKQVIITELALGSTSRDDHAESLAENDLILKEGIETVTVDDSYTIVFQATPAEPNYEASFMDINFDLRRHAESSSLRRRENGTDHSLPLFEKYQFFTPGLSDIVLRSSALYANVNGRDFHGYHRRSHYPVYSWRWSEGSVQPRGVVRSIRQGDGACRPEETAMIR